MIPDVREIKKMNSTITTSFLPDSMFQTVVQEGKSKHSKTVPTTSGDQNHSSLQLEFCVCTEEEEATKKNTPET